MSGYVASARIVRTSPRIVVHRSRDRTAERPPSEPIAVVLDGDATIEGGSGATIQSGSPPRITVAERWSRVRDRWDQLTFFVTDPQSWR